MLNGMLLWECLSHDIILVDTTTNTVKFAPLSVTVKLAV